jgi:hypothetical protein
MHRIYLNQLKMFMKTTLRFFPAITVRQIRLILLIMVFGLQGATYLKAQTTCPSTYTLYNGGSTTTNSNVSSQTPTTGTWTAPATGGPFLIQITAAGAQGGVGGTISGGDGAIMIGTFVVNAGQQLDVTVGSPGSISDYAGGGGGGSGVYINGTTNPLIIAGGGGGAATPYNGGNALTSTTGSNTGSAGNGGAGSTIITAAGGGGGLSSAGQSEESAGGGAGFSGGGGTGFNGGDASNAGNGGGGVGGGGGAAVCLNCGGLGSSIFGGGGGGGYSGGNRGGNPGGGYGGGSINNGTNQSTGSNGGGGYVTVQCLGLANTITTGTITGPFCVGSTVLVPFTANGTYNADNVFTAYLSDAGGSFTNQVSIGTLTSTTSGSITVTIPAGTTTGTGYLINVVSSDPAETGTPNATAFAINALPTGVFLEIEPGNNGDNINGGGDCGGLNGAIIFTVTVPGSDDNWTISFTNEGGTAIGTGSQQEDNSVNTFYAGTYAISSLTDNTTGCSAIASGLTGSQVINPNPTAYTVIGAGSYCAGGVGLPIGLSGSQSGVTYTLEENSRVTTTKVPGTGNVISFGDQTSTSGEITPYSVFAVSNATGCATIMNGSPAIRAIPLPIVVINNPAAVCAPNKVDLTAAAVTAGSDPDLTYTYFNDLAATSAVATPAAVEAGIYYIVGTNSTTECSSTPQSVTVTVNLPTATLSGSANICTASTATLSVALTGTEPWSITYTDGSAVITQNGITASPYSFVVTPTSVSTTYSLTAVNDATCTGTSSGTATVTVGSQAVAGTIGGAAEVCAGINSTTLTLTGYTGTVQWTSSTDNVHFLSILDATGPSYTATDLSTTIYYEAVVTDGGCGSATSGSVAITVDQMPVAGTISGAAEVCAGTNSTTLTLNGYSGNVQWYSSSDNSNFNSIPTATAPSYTATNLSATTYYEAVVTSGLCSSATSPNVTVTVDPAPVAGFISGAASICAGTNVTTLSLSAYSGTIQWYSSANNSSFSEVANASGPSLTVTNLGTTTYYEAVVSSGVCSSATTPSVTMAINPLPGASIGVTGTPVCMNGASPTITFTGNSGTAPYTFTYSMTVGSTTTSGLTATGGSPSASISAPTGTAGTYTYTLTAVTDASATHCSLPITNQSATVTINPVPTATIGVNTSAVCQNGTSPTITFKGSGGTAPYTFTYNINSGGSQTISDLGSGSVILGVPTGTSGNYTYTLTDVQDVNGCTPQSIINQSSDITVNPLPVATINTASMLTALSTGNEASVANAGTGSSYVWTISNGTITSPAGSTGGTLTTNSNIIIYTAGATGNVSLAVTVTTPGGCGPVSSGTLLVPITVQPCPKAEITVASAVCTASTGNVASVASAGAGASYVWTISNGKITAGSGTDQITYTAGASGNTLLSVTVTNASGQCSVSSGTYKVCIIPFPIAAIIAAPVVCSTSTGNIAAVLYGGPGATYAWTITNGTITAGSGTPIIIYKAGSSGSVTLAVTVTNSTGCKASSGSIPVTISAYPVASITAATAVCTGSSGNTASVASAGSGAIYGWSISNGSITSGSLTNSISYTASGSGSVTLSVTVTNNSGCSTASAKKLVTIVGLPAATITTSSSVCSASTGNAASVASGGTGASYTWVITNGTITAGANTAAITYTALSSGIVKLAVTVKNSTGCSAASAKSVTIVASPLATLTATSPVCSASTGNTASVTSAGSGGSYAWTITGGTISSGAGTAAIKYTAPTSGSVVLAVTITSSGGCKAASGNKTITVTAKTVPTFTAVAAQCLSAAPPVLPPTSKNGITGSWSPSTISTAAIGSKNYVFTPAAGQCASSLSISVSVQKCTQTAKISEETPVSASPEKTAATQTEEKLTAVVYPNPSIIGFNLELKSSVKQTVDILVMDVLGHTLLHTRGEATGTYLFGQSFIKGMYMVVVIHQNGIKVLKVIKQ